MCIRDRLRGVRGDGATNEVCWQASSALNRAVCLLERRQDGLHRALNLGISERFVECPEREAQRQAHFSVRYALAGVAIELTKLHEVREGDCPHGVSTVSYTHLRAHETPEHLVCR